MSEEKIEIGKVGGEALMEGIMMRGPKGAAMSLRMADGSIETSLKKSTLPSEKYKFLGWPLIRGPVNLVHSMIFGYKCMMESAEKATEGMIESGEVVAESKLDKWIEAHFGPKMMAVVTGVGLVLGLGVAMLLFVWAPERLAGFIHDRATVDVSRFMPLISGGVRVVLFVGYMFVISLQKDIRRVFQYHGAEHKAIFCYEFGLPLTVDNVRSQSRFHPRCGTSFMFLIILLSILVSSLIMVPDVWREFLKGNTGVRMAVRILQFPIIMAVGYEFIRFAGRHLKNPIVRAISFPGLAMQRITTKEPGDDIIEVGIQALTAALGRPFEAIIPAQREEEEEPSIDDPGSDADSAGQAQE